MNAPAQNFHRPFLALALRLVGVVAFSTLFMLVKYAGENGLSIVQIIFWRQVIPGMLLLAFLAAQRRLGELRTQRLRSHAGRSLMGMCAMVSTFTATILLPLTVSTTLGFTAPLFAVLLGTLAFREHIGIWRWSAVVLGFAGVLLITQPGIEPISPLGAAAGLVAAFISGLVSYQLRDLGRTEAPIAVVFYFSAFGALTMLPLQLFVAQPQDAWQWLLLMAIGVVGLVGQLLLTASLRYGSVTSVIVMDYSGLIWATLFGWAIWDALPSAATWIGAPLVVAAGLIVTWREHRLARRPSPASVLDTD